jgi:CSLREA domain-containing protein
MSMAAVRIAWFLVFCFWGGVASWPALAATFEVNKLTDDNGPCTAADCALREAIIAANENPGLDTVIVPAGVHQLSIPGTNEYLSRTGDLNVFDDLEVRGDAHGRTTILGDGSDHVLSAYGRRTIAISDLTFAGGSHPEGGGGLYIFDTRATLTNLTIRDNHTSQRSCDDQLHSHWKHSLQLGRGNRSHRANWVCLRHDTDQHHGER